MIPPTSIDGTDITGATIDGTDVTEITVDGDTVFSAVAIPDEGDLHARYDATKLLLNDGDTVSTWSDQTGNGHDLTAGEAPTFKTSIINGNPVVRFDGIDEYLSTSFGTLPQPNHIFMVIKKQTNGSDTSLRFIAYGLSSGNRHAPYVNGGTWRFTAEVGTAIVSGVGIDTNPHINATLGNGTSSTLRLDGSQIASGDAGADDLTGLKVGTRNSEIQFGDFDIGEILVYGQDKSGIQTDVEQYLSDKWGITI